MSDWRWCELAISRAHNANTFRHISGHWQRRHFLSSHWAHLAASPVSSMELKLSECVFFAAWEPHDSSSHVWWTINSAQVAAAMGEERERGKGAQCAQTTFHCVYHSTQEWEGAAGPGVLWDIRYDFKCCCCCCCGCHGKRDNNEANRRYRI